MSEHDFSQITEAPGLQATQEQLERAYHRYHFAKQFCEGRDVVEVACGSGIGLGYLATFSKSVIGGDIDEKNLLLAKKQYRHNPKIRVEKMDAHQLPFADKCCDVILLYEAIYYFKEPEKFISESYRVLRDRGVLIICTVNKDWKDFHPSPFTHKYFSADQLCTLVKSKYKTANLFGAFKIEEGMKASIFSFIKKGAMKFDLIPGSLKLRGYLKRVFIGKTFPLPDEIHDGMTTYNPPTELPSDQKNASFKILYAVGRK